MCIVHRTDSFGPATECTESGQPPPIPGMLHMRYCRYSDRYKTITVIRSEAPLILHNPRRMRLRTACSSVLGGPTVIVSAIVSVDLLHGPRQRSSPHAGGCTGAARGCVNLRRPSAAPRFPLPSSTLNFRSDMLQATGSRYFADRDAGRAPVGQTAFQHPVPHP